MQQTFALPCLTQSIPILEPSLVWIIRTRSGLDNCWIMSAAEDCQQTRLRSEKDFKIRKYYRISHNLRNAYKNLKHTLSAMLRYSIKTLCMIEWSIIPFSRIGWITEAICLSTDAFCRPSFEITSTNLTQIKKD